MMVGGERKIHQGGPGECYSARGLGRRIQKRTEHHIENTLKRKSRERAAGRRDGGSGPH